MGIRRALKAITHPLRAASYVYGKVYSRFLSSQVAVMVPGAGIYTNGVRPRVHIHKAPGAEIRLFGRLTIEPWLAGYSPIHISCGAKSRLTIHGDFVIGGGVRISLSEGAELDIGGRRSESRAGITERSIILVHKKVTIGDDFICAWNVFITDCDWHHIEGQRCQADTSIGDHVWIAQNSSVLKGSQIGSGSIIAAGAIAHKVMIPANSLAGGIPCRVLAAGRKWSRDMPVEVGSNGIHHID